MQPTQDKYPVFEANQVLTSAHLNQVFNYLDEQERLTRANLIGIGIVCGLEIRLDVTATATTIHLSKGCGVTSEGYLIVEPEDVALVSYRAGYKVPVEVDYPPFKDKITKVQYPLWELFPAGEPDTTLLSSPDISLNDKAVLLFLELKKDGLRNCSPNDCNDKGSEVTATVRRLLIKIDDLKKIIAAANELASGLTFADLESALLARLNLPDLRLPRYDVPNTEPVTSQDVLAGFLQVFQEQNAGLKLAHATADALSKAYGAFQPLLADAYPFDPFTQFASTNNFGFLDTAPTNTTQVRFLQYYYDFFDDLLRAYDEFRWKGAELMCACCPPEGLFPRHLMLGVLFPASVTNPGLYRHHFLASSAISGCEERTQELLQLFRRLVEMIARFTNNPPLPQASPANARTDAQIRITPSKLADVPLSDKAIPYYYLQNGAPPLFQLWNAEKTRRNRANQNLSYRSDEYLPVAPPFVTNALRYDLEPYNFLRIEGHLGKNYQSVLNTLVILKKQYRLPIEIIALRTGAFDENMPVDLSKEDCRFRDLETLYDTLKEDLRCFLCKELAYFYNIPYPSADKLTLKAVEGVSVEAVVVQPVSKKSLFAIFDQCEPNFQVTSGTMGWIFEDIVPLKDGKIQTGIILTLTLPPEVVDYYYLLLNLHLVTEIIADDLTAFDYGGFASRYQNLVNYTKLLEQKREDNISPNLQGPALLNWEEIDDRLEDILYACRLDAFQSVHDEYVNRIKEVKKKQFLSYFFDKNPGIQHKAGVPLGGTFILVYHDDPEQVTPVPNPNTPLNIGDLVTVGIPTTNAPVPATFNPVVSDAVTRITANQQLMQLNDIQIVLNAFAAQNLTVVGFPPTGGLPTGLKTILDMAVDELLDGTVIADFYLPYICCSDCSPIQYVLPKEPPTFTWEQQGCTILSLISVAAVIPPKAKILITPQGGFPPYKYSVDGGNTWPDLPDTAIELPDQIQVVIRDSDNVESKPQKITVAQPMSIAIADEICDNNQYTVLFKINGGKAPYQVQVGGVSPAPVVKYPDDTDKSKFSVGPVPSGTGITVTVTDSVGCVVPVNYNKTCDIIPPVFEAGADCDNSAGLPRPIIKITVTDGGSDYDYLAKKEDGTEEKSGTLVGTTGVIFVSAGKWTVKLTDKANNYATITLDVPSCFDITAPAFTAVAGCNNDKNPSQATISITITDDGSDYTFEGVNMDNGDKIPPSGAPPVVISGKTGLISVSPGKWQIRLTDQSGNQTIRDVTVLPCCGISTRCGYRFWLPAPPPNYETYQPGVTLFAFDGPNGPVDITNDVNAIIQTSPSQLVPTLFAGTVNNWLDKINKLIATKTNFPDWLRLEYTRLPTEPFGTLWIERFQCLAFEFTLRLEYQRPQILERYTYKYTPSGTEVITIGATGAPTTINIPAVNCTQKNKYDTLLDKTPNWTAVFKAADISLTMQKNTKGAEALLKATATGKDTPMLYLWEIEDGMPALVAGEQARVKILNPESGPKKVRLTAFNKGGGTVTIEETITVENIK